MVTLINSPAPGIQLINTPSNFLIDDRVFPNLGLLSLATYHNWDIVDLAGDPNYLDTAENLEGDTFGFYATSPQFKMVYQIFKFMKETHPRAKFIIGGPHVSAMASLPDDPNWKELKEFDHIVIGEGEQNFQLDKQIKILPLIKDINSLPIPNRDLIDIKNYKYNILGKPTTTIMTQRGCPFDCIFCSGRDVDMYRKVRSHSPEKVAQEMKYLNDKFGFESFMWYDDETNVNPRRLKELSDKIAPLGFQHRGFVRSDLVLKHPETLDYYEKMGFVELCFGAESGSDRVLNTLNKHTTREMNTKAFNLLKDRFRVKVFTMIGAPGEKEEDVYKTKSWIKEMKPDAFDITILTPYPGSTIYNMAKPSTKYKDYNYEYKGLYFNKVNFSKEESFYKGIANNYYTYCRTKYITSKRLIELRDEIEKECRIK